MAKLNPSTLLFLTILTLTSVGMVSAADLTINTPTTLCGVQAYDNVVINNTATICAYNGTVPSGTLTFQVSNFTLTPTGTINGTAAGWRGGSPNSIPSSATGEGIGGGIGQGGGGGYGGAGGDSEDSGVGGQAYGSAGNVTSMGSGGGGSSYTSGGTSKEGAGGGYVFINATKSANISGNIILNGSIGASTSTGYNAAGGGSGGGLWIYTKIITGSATFIAKGGKGGASTSGNGGGGAGGRLLVQYCTDSSSSFTVDIIGGLKGGTGAVNGSIGTSNISAISSSDSLCNSPPIYTQTISSISLFHNQNVTIQLNATDADGDTLTWATNDSIVTINQSGYLSDTPLLTDTGNHSIRLNVTDNLSAAINMDIRYEVINRPVVFTQTLPTISLSHSQNLSIQLNATDADSDIIYWADNTSLFDINASGYIFDDPSQAETGTYSITVNITDNLSTSSFVFNYQIQNAQPTSGIVELHPTAATDSTPINCTTTTAPTDADSDALTYAYNWYNNTILMPMHTFEVGIGNYSTGQKWQCEMVTNDGWVNSSSAFSQEVMIGASFTAPTLNYTNATTALTNIASTPTNPTNNNSWVNLSVTFSDINAGELWTIYFCKSPSSSGACTGGAFCSSPANISSTTFSCRYNVSAESATSKDYWVYVVDNSSLTANLQGIFYLNYPPTTPGTLSPGNATWTNKNYSTLSAASTDSDGDTMTYYIYANTSSAVFLVNSTPTNFNFTSLNETTYYWRVMANDSHGYESSLSDIYQFSVDYTAPFIQNQSISASPYYTDSAVSVYADCGDSFSGPDISSVYYNITDTLLAKSTQTMSYVILNRFMDIYVPLGVTGAYTINQFYCKDNAGNSANISGNITFTTETRQIVGGSGGITIVTPPLLATVSNYSLHFCGDGVCESYMKNNATYTEGPGNCLADCPIDFDQLITCTLKDPSTCFYSESWFVNLLLFAIISSGMVIYIQNSRDNRKINKRGKTY
jgi:hypothetical protein